MGVHEKVDATLSITDVTLSFSLSLSRIDPVLLLLLLPALLTFRMYTMRMDGGEMVTMTND